MSASAPEDSFVLFAIAREYYSLGDFDKAIDFYQKVLKSDPNYVGAYYHLGIAYEENGQLDTAIETYSEGLKVAEKEGDSTSLREIKEALLLLLNKNI